MARQSKLVRTLVQIILALAILAGGGFATVKLIQMKKKPQRQDDEIVPPLVIVNTIRKQDVQMQVEGFGTVQAKVQVQIVPEVSGKVIRVHPGLVNGGFFRAGEELIKIDPRDYELAVERAQAVIIRAKASIQRVKASEERAKAGIEKAKVKLDREKAEALVARQEWEALHPGETPDSPLVLREPQIREAEADLIAAQGDLSAALGELSAAESDLTAANVDLATSKLHLARTTISLPYNGRIIQETVDVGQYLVMGQPVATVYGTDVVEIPVPLEDEDLAWFDAPLNSIDTSKKDTSINYSKAKINAAFAGQNYTWEGQVVRTESQVDPHSRMVHVIVEIKNPFDGINGKVPLVPGMFVTVTIPGKILTEAFVIPRSTVHNNREVWVVNDKYLNIRPVEIIRRDKYYAYITSGLETDTILVVSPLDIVTTWH